MTIIITIKDLEYTKHVMHKAVAHQSLTDAPPTPDNSPQFIYWKNSQPLVRLCMFFLFSAIVVLYLKNLFFSTEVDFTP